MSTNVILRTENLVKTYVTGTVETPALRGVAFELHKGEFTAIAGPSGSGKSTLLHLLGGLDRPTSGEIYLDGVALSTLKRDALSKLRLEKIGFVFQAYNLIPVLTVLENAAFVLELRGVQAARAHGAGAQDPRRARDREVRRTSTRTASRAASSSASRWLAPWSPIRPSSSPTSRRRTSTRRRASS